MKHRIHVARVITVPAMLVGVRLFAWECSRCGECSGYFHTRFRAWWASLYYRRRGVCSGIAPGPSNRPYVDDVFR